MSKALELQRKSTRGIVKMAEISQNSLIFSLFSGKSVSHRKDALQIGDRSIRFCAIFCAIFGAIPYTPAAPPSARGSWPPSSMPPGCSTTAPA
jgi:hypothetical protein